MLLIPSTSTEPCAQHPPVRFATLLLRPSARSVSLLLCPSNRTAPAHLALHQSCCINRLMLLTSVRIICHAHKLAKHHPLPHPGQGATRLLRGRTTHTGMLRLDAPQVHSSNTVLGTSSAFHPWAVLQYPPFVLPALPAPFCHPPSRLPWPALLSPAAILHEMTRYVTFESTQSVNILSAPPPSHYRRSPCLRPSIDPDASPCPPRDRRILSVAYDISLDLRA